MATPKKEDILELSREVAQEVLNHIKDAVQKLAQAESCKEEGEE